MKKLSLFVLILGLLTVATVFLMVTWLRAEDAEERAVRAENLTSLQVEELRKSEEARSVSEWEVVRLSQELSNSWGVATKLRQALVNEQAEVGRLNQELKNANTWYRRTVKAHDEALAEVNRLNQELRNVQSAARASGSSQTSSSSQVMVNRLRQSLRQAEAEVNRLRQAASNVQQSDTSQAAVVRELGQEVGCVSRDVATLLQTLAIPASGGWAVVVPERAWAWLLDQLCGWLVSRL